MNKVLRYQIIMFIIMVIIGICFNPMNMLAYRFSDLYFSLTLFYGGLLMASNMIWGHELVHYFAYNHLNSKVFFTGIFMSISIILLLLREQFLVNEHQWLLRMIPHHSTALTTSEKIYNRTKNKKIKELASDIIKTQEREIDLMKLYLQEQ